MSEVVVQLEEREAGDDVRLMDALDAFAKWCDEVAASDAGAEVGDFMMTTIHTGDMLRRKLIFQDHAQADQFLVFWRSRGGRQVVANVS